MGIMLVYDITNEKSFENIVKWLRNIDEVSNFIIAFEIFLFILNRHYSKYSLSQFSEENWLTTNHICICILLKAVFVRLDIPS